MFFDNSYEKTISFIPFLSTLILILAILFFGSFQEIHSRETQEVLPFMWTYPSYGQERSP